VNQRGKVAIGAALAVLLILVATLPALAAPEPGDVIHIVRYGENLTMIAARYGVSLWDITRANGITNPNRIYVGQRLVIPSASLVGGSTHVVRLGETLTVIGWRYGIDPWAIARANRIANLNLIYVGQRLVIPGVTPVSPAPRLPEPKPPTPEPPQPETWLGPWSAEYFADRALSASPTLTRTDERIAFDWGYDGPADGLPDDSFSVRWTGTFQFETVDYRFFARADDGITVYVDDVLVIDGWRNGSLRTYSSLQNMTAGDHTIVVEYYDYVQVARTYFWARKISGPAPDSEPAPLAGGWSAQFFNNEELAGDPVLTRVDPWIGFEWDTDGAAPEVWADHFSARWTNSITLERDHYRICAMSDDGVRIWVDSDLVVDHWQADNGTVYCGTFYSTGGTHQVKVEYYEHGGDALIYMWWEPH
jgi:LysM repeat protein